LKVPVKKLEALEAGRIDLLPDPTFARGLAASICRGLKIDPKPVLDLMPHYTGTHRVVEPPAINTRFQSGTSEVRRWQRPSPAAVVVLLLLLGALAIYFFPDVAPDESASAPTTETTVPLEPPVTVLPGAAEAPASAPLALPAPAVLEPAPAASVAAPTPAPDASQLVVFQARSESWVQVIDANGVVALRRTLQANETASATGALPLAVVVGRVDAVQVQVRGVPMDLAPLSRNNIARFEVK